MRTPAGNEAGVYIHSDQDGARTFLYPEEALTALDILEHMQPQLREILAQQGRQTQLGSDEENEAPHISSIGQELSVEKTEPGKSCTRDERR